MRAAAIALEEPTRLLQHLFSFIVHETTRAMKRMLLTAGALSMPNEKYARISICLNT